MFIDNVKIFIKAGNGGNGCVSFHREKYVAKGGPDGGDGGRGGNIVFRVDEGINTLLSFKYKRKFVAANGGDGAKSKFHGANAEDLIITVPPGTVIKDAETGRIIKDMNTAEPFICLKGGKGGWGNKHFATPTRQIPRFAKNGIEGEGKEVILELKMLADAGLVGLPNAGKSSILSKISAAKPKIANYRFTTLSPILGVVNTGDEGKGFVVADIPGLIEGAADGAGLGHEFLRHVDRCRLLIHVVDVAGTEYRAPVDDIELINNELKNYSEELANKPQIIAANKCDLLDRDTEEFKQFEEYTKKKGYTVIYVSAMTGEGCNELIYTAQKMIDELGPQITYESEISEEEELMEDECAIKIELIDGVYHVEGKWLYKLMGRINFDDRESLAYFDRMLRKKGIFEQMENAGIKDGDTVNLYDFEFDYVK